MSTPSLEDIDARLKELQKKVEGLQPKKRDNWEKMQMIASIISPLITFFLGFYFINLVNQGIERQKVHVSNVSQMQDLLKELRDPTTPAEEAETAAIALSAFGPAAITPLLNLIQSGEANSVIAGETGLRAIGMTDQALTCQRLKKVIRSRSPLYSWFTHRSAIHLIGDLSCRDALIPIEEYETLLKNSITDNGLAEFKQFVRDNPTVTAESIDLLQKDVERTKKILRKTNS
ncbi:hypothetical protein L0244_23635 [bacterium]|nr:hypothetical protein [bacterium]